MRKYGNGGETDPKKLTPAQWKAKNKALGYLPVNGPRPTPHGEYYDPNKFYQTIDDEGNVVDLPYESYTSPAQKTVIDPNRKPLDFSNPSFKYDPNLGRYFNNVTGDEIKSIVEQYKKGGKIKGYAQGNVVDPPYATPAQPDGFKTVGTPVNVNGAGAGYQYNFQNANQGTTTPVVTQPNPYAKNNKPAISSGTASGIGAATLAAGTVMYNNAVPNQDPKTQGLTTGIDTVASGATPWYALAKGASNMGRSQLKRDEQGNPSTNFSKSADEFLAPQHENAINAYKRDGAEGALKEFFTPQALLRGAAPLLGVGDKTTGFWGKVNKASGLTRKNEDIQEKERIRLKEIYDAENQIKLDNQKLQFNELAQDNLLKRDAGITGNTYKDGGEIKGKGTGTSDSIKAKVEAGSFVVPAAHSAQGKLIRKQILGKSPNKTANLNQAGGTTVKLSDGEMLFTPEEVQKITEAGYDLNALAPDAKDKLRTELNCGGMVKKYAKGGTVGDDDFVKKEKAKIEAERKSDAKKLGASRAKVLADKKYNDLNYAIRNNLTKQLGDKKDYQKSVADTQRELDALKQSYKLFDEQSNTAMNTPTTEAQKLAGANSRPNVEDVRKNREELLNKIKEKEDALAQAKTKLDFANNEKNYINDVSLGLGNTKKGTDPYGVAKQTTTPAANPLADPTLVEELGKMDTPSPSNAQRQAQGNVPQNTVTETADVIQPKSISQIPVTKAEPKLRGADPVSGVPAINTEPLDVNGYTNASLNPPAGEKQRFNLGNTFGTALTYGIPLAQTIIGLDQLKKAGDRPVDRIDQDVLSAVDKTKKNAMQAELDARFGMSPAEKAQLRMQNAGLLNTERYNARNLSGGSSAAALNYERAAVNDAFGRQLSAKVYDDKLKQQKQQIAYGLQDAVNNSVAHKQELNRRLFQDTMGAFQQKTNAAAGLTSTGLSNLYDSVTANNRLNRFYEDYNKANKQGS